MSLEEGASLSVPRNGETMRKNVRVAVVQAESTWFDLDAGIAQVVRLMAEASERGADLIAFPEVFVPGYPWWIWLDTPAAGMGYFARYLPHCMTRDGEHLMRVRRAAAEYGIHVVLGFTEREGGTLYIAQAIIDDAGELVAVRRKLKPTHVERSVFGEGDGSDIRVHETSLGRLGALNCAEHIQPLTKYTMFAQHEEIHVASWPSFAVYQGKASALSVEANTAASRVYALEGQTFVLAPCAVIGPTTQELFCPSDAQRDLMPLGGGAARLYGPEASELADPLPEDAEGLLIADLDADLLAVAKNAYDPVGHYSRPDVFTLLFDPHPYARVRIVGEDDPREEVLADAEFGVRLR